MQAGGRKARTESLNPHKYHDTRVLARDNLRALDARDAKVKR